MNKWISIIHRTALSTRSMPPLLRYTITAALVGVTVLFQFALGGGLGIRSPFLAFIPAIFLSAALLDSGNGFFATILSTLACIYFFLEPAHTFAVHDLHDEADAVLFLIIGFAISSVLEALHVGLVSLAAEREVATMTVRDRSLLLDELAHRTRNDFASVVTLLNLQSRSANEEAREALTAAAERVQTIARVHRRLELRHDRVVVDTKSYIAELCSDLRLSRLALRPIALDCDVESHSISLEKAVPLGLIINESVTNAAKHAFPDQRQGHINVTFRREGHTYRLMIADNGVGDGNVSNGGIGNRLMGMLAAQLGAKLEIEPKSPGIAVVVDIPVKTER